MKYYVLLQLLLRSQIVGVSTLCFSTIGRPLMQPSVALTTDHLVAVVLLREDLQRRLDYSTPEPQYQMQRRLLLYVVVREGSTILELFTGENQPLLVGRYAFLVLYFCFHVLNRVRGLNLKCDRLPGECFHENLHRDVYLQTRIRLILRHNLIIDRRATLRAPAVVNILFKRCSHSNVSGFSIF